MGLISFFLRTLRGPTPSAQKARVDAIHARIGQLTNAAAERSARDGLRRRAPFRATESSTGSVDAERIARLPKDLGSLLGEYSTIELGGMQIERSAVRAYDRHSEWVQIGTDLEHAAIVVRPMDGHIFVIEDDGAPEPDLSDEHPSIWHYLLEVAEHTTGTRHDQAPNEH